MKVKETRGRKKKYNFPTKGSAKFVDTAGVRIAAHLWAKKNGIKIRTWAEAGMRVIVVIGYLKKATKKLTVKNC